jgi:hypothetical protein
MLVVAEYNRYVFENEDYGAETHRMTGVVLKCAADLGLVTLDMFEVDRDAVRQRGIAALFRRSHPSPDGAKLTADAIAGALEKRQMLKASP